MKQKPEKYLASVFFLAFSFSSISITGTAPPSGNSPGSTEFTYRWVAAAMKFTWSLLLGSDFGITSAFSFISSYSLEMTGFSRFSRTTLKKTQSWQMFPLAWIRPIPKPQTKSHRNWANPRCSHLFLQVCEIRWPLDGHQGGLCALGFTHLAFDQVAVPVKPEAATGGTKSHWKQVFLRHFSKNCRKFQKDLLCNTLVPQDCELL